MVKGGRTKGTEHRGRYDFVFKEAKEKKNTIQEYLKQETVREKLN